MGCINYFIVMIVIVSIINHSFSAVHHQFERVRDRNADYNRSKSASNHRGILLSYSSKKKTDMCNELFPPITPTETATSGRPSRSDASDTESAHEREKQRSLFKATIVTIGESQANEESLFFTCFGYRTSGNGIEKSIMLSSAFRPGFMYEATEAKNKEDDEESVEIRIRGYMSMSPEYVELNHEELETRYVSIRRRLRVLAKELSLYYELIQTKSDLSELTGRQLFLLCESIVSSPIYQQEGFKLDTNRRRFSSANLGLTLKPLAFRNKDYSKEIIKFQCVICKVTRTIQRKETVENLYVTPSYDNKNSVYVLKVNKEMITLDKYFINVPILMNVHDSTTVEDT